MAQRETWAAACCALAIVLSCAAPACADDAAPSPELDPHPFEAHRFSLEVPTLHALGVMTSMRVGAAIIWPEPFAESDPLEWAGHYGEAVRLPPRFNAATAPFEWDGDRWPLNVVGHGLFGSELYLRARMCRANPLEALLFAAGSSAAWEYVFEGNAVRPSGQDLVYTPLAGLALGELRFAAWHGAARLAPPWRGVLTFAVDPLGELERALGAPC